VELALGYAAGNVPGTALLIALLAGSANFAHQNGAAAPAILVRNSRHEPLFAPWVLSAVEAVDPELVASTAVMLWDYQDAALQGELMRSAGLLIAAAGDEAIAALDALRSRHAPECRFHRHGHKVSFAVIAQPTPEAARLAALDSSLWDQNGCLSARIHFVEGDAAAYAGELASQMRALAGELPRGTTPRRFIHRAFDAYATLEVAGHDVSVCSTYDDDFAVVLDHRRWNRETLARAVNACQGRAVIVRPVASALDVPRTLGWLPAANLQSASVAMSAPQALEFANAAGACGVTAVRSLGRAAFPQLAYSWDGLLPLDLGCLRPEGRFTTVEFDDPTAEMALSLERWG
jgi:Acyl-CoA reductase (LuxC)